MDYSKKQMEREKKAEISSSRPYFGKIINIRVDKANYIDGTSRNIEVVEHPGAVLIIPITAKGKIVFIKQYRTVVNQILIELPAGTIEKNETSHSTAQRELEEETGFKAKQLIPLFGFYPSPGFCTEYIHTFIAKDLQPGISNHDEDEGIDNVEMSLSDACHMINLNKIIDGKTIVALFKYMTWLKKIL